MSQPVIFAISSGQPPIFANTQFYMINIGVGLVAEFWKPFSGNRQVPVVSKLVEQFVCVLTPANISRSGAVLQVCFPLGRRHGIILDSLIFRRPVRVDGLPANGRHLDIKAAGEKAKESVKAAPGKAAAGAKAAGSAVVDTAKAAGKKISDGAKGAADQVRTHFTRK